MKIGKCYKPELFFENQLLNIYKHPERNHHALDSRAKCSSQPVADADASSMAEQKQQTLWWPEKQSGSQGTKESKAAIRQKDHLFSS